MSADKCLEGGKFKLHYFNVKSRAELTRFIFHFAKVDFEDYRFEGKEWPELKKNYATGQVPILEHFDASGKKDLEISQSMAIARLVATKFDLAGCNALEAAKCDEIIDCVLDFFNMATKTYYGNDEMRKSEAKDLLKKDSPRILSWLEEKLKTNGGKHFVGNKMTWADLAVTVFLRGAADYAGKDIWTIIEEGYPTIVALIKAVEAEPNIAAYLAKRPESTI